MLYISDTVCHLLHIEYPYWKISHEHDPDLAIKSRGKVFTKILKKESLIFGFHLPFPTIGNIQKNKLKYSWYPII